MTREDKYYKLYKKYKGKYLRMRGGAGSGSMTSITFTPKNPDLFRGLNRHLTPITIDINETIKAAKIKIHKQIMAAVEYYDEIIRQGKTIYIGDTTTIDTRLINAMDDLLSKKTATEYPFLFDIKLYFQDEEITGPLPETLKDGIFKNISYLRSPIYNSPIPEEVQLRVLEFSGLKYTFKYHGLDN